MKMKIAIAAALALGACGTTSNGDGATASSGGPHSDCFRANEVTGYGVVDDNHVRLNVGTREYIFTITRNSRDLDWNHAISVRSITTFICTGSGTGVQLMGGDPPIPTQVTQIVRGDTPAPQGS
ncbi:MAG: DUF6491 family protein [Terricaulis sp.]